MSIQVKDAKTITLGGKDVKKIAKTDGTILWQSAIDPTSSEYWGTGSKANEWTQTFIDSLQTLSDSELATLVGKTRYVSVNGLDHLVRVIGYNHDDLSSGTGKAKLTFQFAQLISDSAGHSLATTWNGDGLRTATNYDYRSSTLKDVFEGTGAVTWYEKAGTTPSTTYTTSVLSMLPSIIQTNLKEVTKKVGVSTTGWTYTSQTFNSKVFPIAYCEMTATSSSYAKDDEGTIYSYWNSHDTDSDRIIKQVKDGDVVYTTIATATGSGGTVYNYAGYNYKADATGGGFEWIRSPRLGSAGHAWGVGSDGFGYYLVSYNSRGVAPCFCI